MTTTLHVQHPHFYDITKDQCGQMCPNSTFFHITLKEEQCGQMCPNSTFFHI